MNLNYLIFKKYLYLFFILFSLNYFFLSTNLAFSKNINIENIKITKNFDQNFEKNVVINSGFSLAFKELMHRLIKSTDQDKINNISLKSIRTFIDNFSIKEEKFIDNKYFVTLDVSFNKQKIFDLLEKKNVFPSLTKKKKLMFIPILVDQDKNDIILFSENEIYLNWIKEKDNKSLLEFILPNEDLEDIILIKSRYDELENYDFNEIINKYNLEDYIITLFYKNSEKIRVLSKVKFNKNLILDNQEFENYKSISELDEIIEKLKVKFTDFWKNENQINTSIKLPLLISVDLRKNNKIKEFENVMNNLDLVSNYFVSSIDNKKIYYTLIFNGTHKTFINSIEKTGLKLDVKNKIWNIE